jgi:hypothetical protein
MYYSHSKFVQQKNELFPLYRSFEFARVALYATGRGSGWHALSSREEQKPTKINNSGREGLVTTQQKSTNINRNQQKLTESAKVIKISTGPRAQSAKISNSQQKSAKVSTFRFGL